MYCYINFCPLLLMNSGGTRVFWAKWVFEGQKSTKNPNMADICYLSGGGGEGGRASNGGKCPMPPLVPSLLMYSQRNIKCQAKNQKIRASIDYCLKYI